jgi:hypothetical protein
VSGKIVPFKRCRERATTAACFKLTDAETQLCATPRLGSVCARMTRSSLRHEHTASCGRSNDASIGEGVYSESAVMRTTDPRLPRRRRGCERRAEASGRTPVPHSD